MTTINDIKNDRMRFTKNKLSATLTYVAIFINVLYFVSIYKTDVGSYFYKFEIGLSVVYNLLFMLFAFLASEGVKSYDYRYSMLLIVLGAMQIVRIFGIPLEAYNTVVKVGTKSIQAMQLDQLVRCIVYLTCSSVAAISAGIIGIVKTKKLRNHEKKLGLR